MGARSIRIALVAAMLALTGVVSPMALAAENKVIIAQGPKSLIYSAVYVALSMFPDVGLEGDIQFLRGGAEALASVLSGGAHIYVGPPSTAMKAIAKDQDLKVFAAVVGEFPHKIVIQGDIAKKLGLTAAMPVRQRVLGLKGLTIGTSAPGSGPEQLFRYVLRAEGLSPDRDLTISPLGDTGPLLAAFEQRRIDGFIYSSPAPDIAIEKFSAFPVVDFAKGEYEGVRHVLYHTLISPNKWLSEDAERATKVVVAFWRAIDLMRKNPAKAKTIVRPYFKDLDEPAFNQGFDAAVAPLVETPMIEAQSIEINRNFMKVVEGVDFTLPIGKVYTNDYVERARGMIATKN